MITLQQLAIPNYRPLRKVQADALRGSAMTVLRKRGLIPQHIVDTEIARLIEEMISDLCELLANDEFAGFDPFNDRIEGLITKHFLALATRALYSADQLGLLQCKIELEPDFVKTLEEAVRSVLSFRVADIMECLTEHYEATLYAKLDYLNEFNDFDERVRLRDSIANELDDAFKGRAQMSADEAAVWLLNHTVGRQIDIALSSLKHGKTLVDAVNAAKRFEP